MKTLIKKLKFGVLLVAIVILTSCRNDINSLSVAGINTVYCAIPFVTKTTSTFVGNKISKYFKNFSTAKNEEKQTSKKKEIKKSNHKAMPITLGVIGGARLVSSNSR